MEDAEDALLEQVDDLLGDIEEVLSVPPPPMTGWSSIPPAKPSIDHLAELAAELGDAPVAHVGEVALQGPTADVKNRIGADGIVAGGIVADGIVAGGIGAGGIVADGIVADGIVADEHIVDMESIDCEVVDTDVPDDAPTRRGTSASGESHEIELASEDWLDDEDEVPTQSWARSELTAAAEAGPAKSAPAGRDDDRPTPLIPGMTTNASKSLPPVVPTIPTASSSLSASPSSAPHSSARRSSAPPPARSSAFLSKPDAWDDDWARDEMPSLVEDDMEDAAGTLRPSAVSLRAARPNAGRRVPIGYVIGALAAITAAGAAYYFGPHNGTRPQDEARHVATMLQPEQTPPLVAYVIAPPEAAPTTERLMISVNPSSAYVSVRKPTEKAGKRAGGPWPKAFDLEPATYEIVAFQKGYKPVVRRITVQPGITPTALDLRLSVDDIYE